MTQGARTLFLAVALVGVLVLTGGSASAQVPIAAGSSFGTAPLLAPGTYTDTIQQLEELYVTVDLGDGQRIRVTATVAGQPEGPTDSATIVGLGLYNRAREPVSFGNDAFFDGRTDATTILSLNTPIGYPDLTRPGRHFVVIEMRDAGNQELAGRDYQYRLTIAVDQDRQATTTTTTVSDIQPTAPAPEAPGSPPKADGGSGGGGARVAGGLASFTVGVAGGGTAMWIRRRVRPALGPAKPTAS